MDKLRKKLMLLVVFASVMFGMAATVSAATPKSVKLNANGKNTKYDITGDGKSDTIQFINRKDNTYGYNRLTVKINGRTAYTKSTHYYTISAYHLTLKNGKKYLFIMDQDIGGCNAITGLFRYSNGKLVQEVDFNKMGGSKPHFSGLSMKLLGNTVRVWADGLSRGLFHFIVFADATYSGGKMVLRTSNIRFSARDKSTAVRNGATTYVMAKTVQGYTSRTGSKKKFVVKSGTKVKLKKYYLNGTKARILIQLTNGKQAWINDTFGNNYAFLLKGIELWA